ncbi:MAG: peptide-methionine (S)-S-oxide reductase MsrA [Lachnospirales bacterium]
MGHLPENINLSLEFDLNSLKEIYLAGGCYWGTQAYMDRIKGVYESSVGFANGHSENPTYEDVCTGETGYAETVKIVYDVTKTNLISLLNEYFSTINPTSINKQGGDFGHQYRTGIYFVDEGDTEIINSFLKEKEPLYSLPLAIEVQPLKNYYEAHEAHQKYLEKNPNGYCHINLEVLRNKKQ